MLIKKLDKIKNSMEGYKRFWYQKNVMSYTEEFQPLVSPWFIADKVDYKLIFYPLLHVTYLRSGHGAIKPENSKIWRSFLCQSLPSFSSLNSDSVPNPDPRFWWSKNWSEKNTAGQFFISFWSKVVIYLSLGLHKGRPSYRRSLQPSKENIQHFKTWNLCFLHFLGNFCLAGSRPGSRLRIRGTESRDPGNLDP